MCALMERHTILYDNYWDLSECPQTHVGVVAACRTWSVPQPALHILCCSLGGRRSGYPSAKEWCCAVAAFRWPLKKKICLLFTPLSSLSPTYSTSKCFTGAEKKWKITSLPSSLMTRKSKYPHSGWEPENPSNVSLLTHCPNHSWVTGLSTHIVPILCLFFQLYQEATPSLCISSGLWRILSKCYFCFLFLLLYPLGFQKQVPGCS